MPLVFQPVSGTGSPEGVITATPGSIWIQTDAPASIWRKSSGTGNTGWTRGDLSLFNIRDFGAQINNSADDTEAWQAAIDAAKTAIDNELALNAVVYHPGGLSLISATIALPDDLPIQVVGGPNAVLKADPNSPPFGPMLKLNSTVPGPGSRYGTIRDLRIEGSSIATTGLEVFAVNREFENVSVRFCTKRGLYLHSAQNCTFVSCQFEENGSDGALDANCVIDLGAGNNNFYGCQFNVAGNTPEDRGQYHLVIQQSGQSPSGGIFNQPEMNTFVGCQFERTSYSTLGAILQRAGRNNTFIGCTIQTNNFNSELRRAVTVNDDDRAATGALSSALRLSNCRLFGSRNQQQHTPATDSIAISVSILEAAAPAAVVAENLFLENFGTAFEIIQNTDPEEQWSHVELAPPLQSGAVWELCQSGALLSDSAVVLQRTLRINGVPTDPAFQSANAASWLYDGTNHLVHFYAPVAAKWRSVDVVQQEIGSEDVSGTDQVNIDTAGIRYYRVNVIDSGTGGDLRIYPPDNSVVGRILTIDFYHDFSGSLSGDVDFTSSGTPGFRLASNAFTFPDEDKHTLITFTYDGDNWREISRAENLPA